MTREDEISELLQEDTEDILLGAHERLEAAANELQWSWNYSTRLAYDFILTRLNYEITDLTELTSPDDLEIARRLIGDEFEARRYANDIAGTGLSDSS